MSTTLNDLRTAQKSHDAKQDVKDNYDALRSDVAELAKSVKELASSEFGDVAQRAQDTANKGLAQAERSIRQNPAQAAMIAAGVGFVVGLLLSR